MGALRLRLVSGLILSLALTLSAQAAALDPRLAITGAVEDLPMQWGEARIAAPAIPELPIQVSSAAEAVVLPAAAPESQGGAGTPTADQVSGLVIRARPRADSVPTVARCLTGPAWWRVTKGETTLWIVGTPDQIPMDTIWDDTCLKVRLNGARAVIVPAIPLVAAFDPFARGDTPLRAQSLPLSERLPPPLWERLTRRIVANPIRQAAELQWARGGPPGFSISDIALGRASGGGRTTLQVIVDTPNLYAPPIIVAERLARGLDWPGKLGNPVADRTVEVAGKANMLIGRTRSSQAEFPNLIYLSNPAEADQIACLTKVLDAMDAGHTASWRLAQIQAWADGSYQQGLRRMSVLDTCALGDLSVRFWSSVVAQYMELIDRQMQQPGIVVAVVEFDPLFLKGGILERLQAEGFTITPPEALN
ncbi:MAG: TraB/GumN family protein [Caulobacteraceae bacterium]|nr:TraB/GumN family protein [Caulobacteraceae bacterium]